MPERVIRSRRVRWAVGLFIGYWLLARFVEPIELAQVLTLTLIGIAFAVVTKYWNQVWTAVLEDDLGPYSQLATGILLAFFGLGLALVWSMLGRLVPGLEWMRTSPMQGFWLFLYNLAGVLHITAPRNEQGQVDNSDWKALAVAIGSGLVASLVLLFLEQGSFLRRPL